VAPWVQRNVIGHDLQFRLCVDAGLIREQGCGSSGWQLVRWAGRDAHQRHQPHAMAHGARRRSPVQLLNAKPSGPEKLHPAVPVNGKLMVLAHLIAFRSVVGCLPLGDPRSKRARAQPAAGHHANAKRHLDFLLTPPGERGDRLPLTESKPGHAALRLSCLSIASPTHQAAQAGALKPAALAHTSSWPSPRAATARDAKSADSPLAVATSFKGFSRRLPLTLAKASQWPSAGLVELHGPVLSRSRSGQVCAEGLLKLFAAEPGQPAGKGLAARGVMAAARAAAAWCRAAGAGKGISQKIGNGMPRRAVLSVASPGPSSGRIGRA